MIHIINIYENITNNKNDINKTYKQQILRQKKTKFFKIKFI
jgi:hypothetical protein